MSSTFLSIIFGTFILEDVAIASAIILIQQSQLTPLTAFLACFIGISLGDIIVYFMGLGVFKIKSLEKIKVFKAIKLKSEKIKIQTNFMSAAVVLSRFVPGTRVPTYFLAGFTGFNLIYFVVLTIITVSVWVFLTLFLGVSIARVVSANWYYVLFIILAVFYMIKKIAYHLSDPWRRKAWFYSYQQWLSFEFWPAYLFYLPVIAYSAICAIRSRGLFFPLYANPEFLHAGLIGESKWDFYKTLRAPDTTLKTQLFEFNTERTKSIKNYLDQQHISYPFILKPDKGQRGFGVRIIKNENELSDYLENSKFDVLVQEYCAAENEAGVFYIRYPNADKGFIFSITDKVFPFVVGDGQSRIGDLILNDKRARIIAQTYFERFEGQLNRVLQPGEKLTLASCGNHCQGAIFKNGHFLNSPALLSAIEAVVNELPNFYFGRIDMRYKSHELLKQGLEFKVIEINGAGSEATHIWDEKTTLKEAYKVLFEQWRILFEIGKSIYDQNKIKHNVQLSTLIKELVYQQAHDKRFTISS